MGSLVCSGIDGGLWPLFWIAVVICATIVYLANRRTRS